MRVILLAVLVFELVLAAPPFPERRQSPSRFASVSRPESQFSTPKREKEGGLPPKSQMTSPDASIHIPARKFPLGSPDQEFSPMQPPLGASSSVALFSPTYADPVTKAKVNAMKKKDPEYTKKLDQIQQSPGGRFYVQSGKSPRRELAHGHQAFIKTPRGTVRAQPAEKGTHGTISGMGKVGYAGEAKFSEGKLEYWTNNSGTYRPPTSEGGPEMFSEGPFKPV